MRKSLITAALLATLTAAHAEDLTGREMQIGPNSTPLCTSLDDLEKFMIAMLGDDAQKASGICYLGKPGMDIDVLQDMNADSDMSLVHVLRVAVVGGGTALPAYTISKGVVPR